MGDPTSTYDRVVAIYSRKCQGDLIRCFGGQHQKVQAYWHVIQQQLEPHEFDSYRSLSSIVIEDLSFPPDIFDFHEFRLPCSAIVAGIILCPVRNEHANTMVNFDEFLSHLLLPNIAQLSIAVDNREVTEDALIANKIVDLCSDELLFQPPNSEWEPIGREYLLQNVSLFTSRKLTIQMCLPAFPCKSSNPEKVAGKLPDLGEELAIRRLYSVLRQIRSLYEPGASICIVSDGHVFSDCIGVDDHQVDEYGRRLHEINQNMIHCEKHTSEISIISLKDIFHSMPKDIIGERKAHQIQLPVLQHFLGTTISKETEFCRQALQLACQPKRSSLRASIKAQDPAVLPLYRGFSRFMLEDLALHPYSQSISRSQRKKTAEKISFEMLLRNQAYSNLVELFFPLHIRLSIHAHVNSGPKFGISLFDRSKTRVIDDLKDFSRIAQPSHDILHIPTPWHNCVFQVPQSDLMYVTKSKVINEARMSRIIQARWIQGDFQTASGGYFEVSAPILAEEDRFTSISSPKPPIISFVHERAIQTSEDMKVEVKKESKYSRRMIMRDLKRLLESFRIRVFYSQTAGERNVVT